MSQKPPRPTIGIPAPFGHPLEGAQGNAPSSPLAQAFKLFQAGNLRRAEKICRDILKSNPSVPDALHLLGVIEFQRGNAEAAVRHLEKVIKSGSVNPSHMANYARALSAIGRFTDADAMFKRALDLNPDDSGTWNDRGNTLMKSGNLSEAEKSYRRAIDLAAHDPKAYVNLSQLLLALGRNNEALDMSRQAEGCAPDLAAVQNSLGTALAATGDAEGAVAAYENAHDRDPKYAEPLANLASLHEELNDIDKARRVAERAIKIDKRNAHALLVLAKCDRRQNNMEDAVKRLKRVNVTTIPAPLYRDVAFELSRLYDRMDKTTEAFAAMNTGNAQALIAEGVDETLGDQFLDTVDRLRDWMTPDTADSLKQFPAMDDDNADPVFLIGFPRSGTTLLGQVLDSHTGLVLVEERPMLDQLITSIRNDRGGYPDGVLSLDQATLKDLRQRYFEAVDRECDRMSGQRVVDKFPLHLVHVGLIRAIFPNAKFILALRHPCDVVLSCFMQNFRPNPAMANFFSIERGARTYDRVMALWTVYEAELNPAAHSIRYENVVTDFDAEISTLLDFLGLEWEDSVRDFAERARSRGKIDTPSYAQVTEELYTRARYRWRRYEQQMQPAMTSLGPWIKHFGYEQE